MKVTIKSYHAVAAWKWDTSDEPHKVFKYAGASDDPYGDDDDDDDECGICRLAFESCCPDCKVPGDDCPLSESDHLSGRNELLSRLKSARRSCQSGGSARTSSTCTACSSGSARKAQRGSVRLTVASGVSRFVRLVMLD